MINESGKRSSTNRRMVDPRATRLLGVNQMIIAFGTPCEDSHQLAATTARPS